MGKVPPYSEEEKAEIFKAIFSGMSEGKSLRRMCIEQEISTRTFYDWIEKSEELQQQYAHATEERAAYYFDEIFEIAYNPEYGKKRKVIEENGEEKKVEVTRGDMIEHRKLKIDALKWALSRMKPKKYGNKIDVTSDGEKFSGDIVIQSQGVLPEVTEGGGGSNTTNETNEEENEE